ncbi:prolyl oligopeptidase family serine peptidase [Prosthecobacter dejongeii]|uniref:Dipeptidyl aminopeptidase/acylaminoacyl peptidase n=1 Tax=Prosthecobacter dejongeii TaxID=48465 RepID=A0A7W8DQF5_9BACT|nr:prolyl oligopeptidase family serine peptidase [Prosthecobacter dejongeii]MBB5038150.1 dipeptidyl aminopeptidase/acylaminoacyl peptidase [Prosthecobacter dejongeii]
MFRLLFVFILPAFFLQAASVDEALLAAKKWDNQLFRNQVKAVWLDENTFWYRLQTGAKSSEYVRIDARTGERRTAATLQGIGLPEFETLKTSQSQEKIHPSGNGLETKIVFSNRLSKPVRMTWIDARGKHHSYKALPPGETFRQNTFVDHVWLVSDLDGRQIAVVSAKIVPLEVEIDAIPSAAHEGVTSNLKAGEILAPNGQWSAWVENGQLMLKDQRVNKTMQIKRNFEPALPFQGGITWAPDSSCFVVSCAADVTKRHITLIESSPPDQVEPKRKEITYSKAGDDLFKPMPVIVRLTPEGHACKAVQTELFSNPFIQTDHFDIRWAPDSREFYFDYNQRGHQLYRIIGVDAFSANARTVVEESSKTFVDHTQKTWRQWLDKSHELLWMSERDGWCHLWLYDSQLGQVKQQVTRGEWVVRKVLEVNEATQQVWFMASGLRKEEDPYHQHLYRIHLDGTGFKQLTEGDGQHEIEWSPNKRYFIDTWSRVDLPQVIELRRSEDGSRVCLLEKATAQTLLATGWQMPERFVAKGRDGHTDIHGIIIKPSFFDPTKKYPVVEQIYAGPHSAFVPKTFGVLSKQHRIAELGFIVVQADGLGTNHRGKKFHEVCWKNLKDAGFPDRIAWIKMAGASRPWMDLTRVGIYGGSAGGQSAMRALLDHHDFYHVAMADCGCHDNRMDKIWWNEQWMGWPLDESYKRSSNVEDAAKLQGKLLLVVGELDDNVDPSSTLQVVHALQKAGKSFEFMPIIGAGHGAAETPFGSRLLMDFLVKHLHP